MGYFLLDDHKLEKCLHVEVNSWFRSEAMLKFRTCQNGYKLCLTNNTIFGYAIRQRLQLGGLLFLHPLFLSYFQFSDVEMNKN